MRRTQRFVFTVWMKIKRRECVCVPSVCDDGVMIVSCFSLPKETTRSPKSEENDSLNFCRQPSDQKAMKHF